LGQLVFIVGPSGMGKSTSGRNLDCESTMILNSDQKALPFKKFKLNYNEEKGNYLQTSNTTECVNGLKASHKNPEIKRVLLDTWSRIMTDAVMSPDFRKEKDSISGVSFLQLSMIYLTSSMINLERILLFM